jgi:hypothetical protein
MSLDRMKKIVGHSVAQRLVRKEDGVSILPGGLSQVPARGRCVSSVTQHNP